jgi:hypothetical protein
LVEKKFVFNAMSRTLRSAGTSAWIGEGIEVDVGEREKILRARGRRAQQEQQKERHAQFSHVRTSYSS